MRFAVLGLAALGILWLAMWASDAPTAPPTLPTPTVGSAGDLARRIGSGEAPPTATIAIAVSTTPSNAQMATSSTPVRHDPLTARAVWGAPAEFAPAEE